MKEIRVDIIGYEGLYHISNLGRVKSLKRQGVERILRGIPDKDGYLKINLWKGKQIKMFAIHRLVAICFIDNPNNLPQVNHKNNKRYDNRLKNLERCTHQENIIHKCCTNKKYKMYFTHN